MNYTPAVSWCKQTLVNNGWFYWRTQMFGKTRVYKFTDPTGKPQYLTTMGLRYEAYRQTYMSHEPFQSNTKETANDERPMETA